MRVEQIRGGMTGRSAGKLYRIINSKSSECGLKGLFLIWPDY